MNVIFALRFLTNPLTAVRLSLAPAEPACHSFTTEIDAPQRWQTNAVLLRMTYGTMIDRLTKTLKAKTMPPLQGKHSCIVDVPLILKYIRECIEPKKSADPDLFCPRTGRRRWGPCQCWTPLPGTPHFTHTAPWSQRRKRSSQIYPKQCQIKSNCAMLIHSILWQYIICIDVPCFLSCTVAESRKSSEK